MYSPFRHAGSIVWKRRPIHLTFFLTRRCNSRCPFCFYLANADSASRAEELTLDEIRRISSSLGKLLWLAFSGGEIYLRDDLVDIADTFYVNNRPPIMLFPTNGMLPAIIRDRTERILKNSPRSVVVVKLSLDGIGTCHDEIRDTPGSFSNTMETYCLLAELLDGYSNFELGVNTVFCSENQDKMDSIIDFVGNLHHIKTHTISLVRGNLANRELKNVDFGKYLQAAGRLERKLKTGKSAIYRFRGAGIKAAQDILQRKLIHRTMMEKKSLLPCYAGRLNLVLNEKGEVFPCEILEESFGNVRDLDYSIEKVIRSVRAEEIRDFIGSGRCYCTHECYFMTNILFNPATYPGLIREYVRLRRLP
ncbi:MAG: radical SAM protein [Candidatus Sulfobium sp.]|jgi:MoaA/NifB/PqqE/SkfB family radical SAM enzyme